MGTFYINTFWNEIDSSVTEKLEQVKIMMEQRALNFDVVNDFFVLEEIIQEQVKDAFIAKADGKVFYSKDSSRIGKPYHLFLDKKESLPTKNISEKFLTSFTLADNQQFISVQSPLMVNDRLLGMLYIRINSEEIQQKKRAILLLFLFGSFVTIVVTTLLEALLVHRIFVPRIKRASAILKEVEGDNLSVRVPLTGSNDELELLIEQINTMVAEIECNTNNLHLLNTTAENFTKAQGKEELGAILINVMDEYFPEPLPDNEKSRLLETISSFSGKISFEHELVKLFKEKKGRQVHEHHKEFIRTLSSLTSSALKREMALEKTKKAEEKYRDLFESASEGIFRTTADGKLLIANPSLLAMFGYDNDIDLVPTESNFIRQAYLNPEDRLPILEKINREGGVNDIEAQFRRKDGSTFWASLSARVAKTQVIDGRIIDISERKLKEKALRDRQVAEATAQAQADIFILLEEQNEKLKRTLEELKVTHKKLVQSEKMSAIGLTASGVAHDLNNILSGVIGYPELLLLKLPEESELRPPVKAIMASGKRAAAVVADLLTLSRDAAQTRETISLNSLIEEYLHSAEFQELKSTYPDIYISTQLNPDLFEIHCSVSHIQKVVMNLLINALEAVGNTGEIILSTENRKITHEQDIPAHLKAGDYVVMKIIDSGAGINDQDVKHIFEPFYTRKKMGRSGTGIGLTVVANVIEEHNGAITVANTEEGTSFSIYLPATKEKYSKLVTHTPLKDLLGKASVLVVDDDELQRDISTQMLAQFGYTANAVPSGEEALKYLQKNQADLILLDMLMPPGMNGRETYEAIIKIIPDQRAIIVSGFSENEDVQRAIQLGAKGLLKKPYTMEELGKTIRDGLR